MDKAITENRSFDEALSNIIAEEDTNFLLNNTLYINNLNERVRLEDLKEELHKLFSEFGAIIEIKAKKDIRMRG